MNSVNNKTESTWSFFDQLVENFNHFIDEAKEVIDTVGNQINDFVEKRSKEEGAISLLKNNETTIVPQDIFKIIISFSEEGILHTTIFVCRSWAKESFDLMKKIEVNKIERWAPVMPDSTLALLPAQVKKIEGEHNVKALMQSNETFIRAELKNYSVDELIQIQGKAFDCQLGNRAYELISVALIEHYESELDSLPNKARRAQLFYQIGLEFQILLGLGTLSGASEIFSHLTSKYAELEWALVDLILLRCDQIEGVKAKVEFLSKFNLRRGESISFFFNDLYTRLLETNQTNVVVAHALHNDCIHQAATAILCKIWKSSQEDYFYDYAEDVKTFAAVQTMVTSPNERGRLNVLIWQLPKRIQEEIQFKK